MLASDPLEAGAASARVYGWNTAGSIVDSIGATFVMLPEFGFAGALCACVTLSHGPEILEANDPLIRVTEARDHTFFILRRLIPFRSERLL